jgi:hypothetical protein
MDIVYRLKHSPWTPIIVGNLILSIGVGLICDGSDDYLQAEGGQYLKDYDEGFIVIGVFAMTLGVLLVLKGARSFLGPGQRQPMRFRQKNERRPIRPGGTEKPMRHGRHGSSALTGRGSGGAEVGHSEARR